MRKSQKNGHPRSQADELQIVVQLEFYLFAKVKLRYMYDVIGNERLWVEKLNVKEMKWDDKNEIGPYQEREKSTGPTVRIHTPTLSTKAFTLQGLPHSRPSRTSLDQPASNSSDRDCSSSAHWSRYCSIVVFEDAALPSILISGWYGSGIGESRLYGTEWDSFPLLLAGRFSIPDHDLRATLQPHRHKYHLSHCCRRDDESRSVSPTSFRRFHQSLIWPRFEKVEVSFYLPSLLVLGPSIHSYKPNRWSPIGHLFCAPTSFALSHPQVYGLHRTCQYLLRQSCFHVHPCRARICHVSGTISHNNWLSFLIRIRPPRNYLSIFIRFVIAAA